MAVRHCLSKEASHSGFPQISGGRCSIAPSLLTSCIVDDEPRLHAYGSPPFRNAPSRGAVTRLSYPETPGFPRCRLRQVSPCSPRTSPYAHQPSCAADVAPFRYAPSAGLDPLSRSTRSHGHCLPCAVSWSPNLFRRRAGAIGSKGGIAPPSARRNAASPIKGTALQRLLDRGLAILRLPDWRSGVAFRPVCCAAWRAAR